MEKLKQALVNNDYLTISEMYLQDEISKDNLTTYKTILKILYSKNMNEKVKNKEEHEKDFLMIKLIIERSGFNVSFRPEGKRPILYNVLKINNKPLSVYIARLLKDEDVEFDLPENFIKDKPEILRRNSNIQSSVNIAVLKKNLDFLKYLFLERKFLKDDPYIYHSTGTLINDNDIYFKRTSLFKILENFKTLVEDLSNQEYAENFNFDEIKELLISMIPKQYNLNKLIFLEKNISEIIKDPDIYDSIVNNFWYNNQINKQGDRGFYKNYLNKIDPFKKVLSQNNSQSLIDKLFRFNAHSWIETLIRNEKINTKNITLFLEDEYLIPESNDFYYLNKNKGQEEINEEVIKTFDLLIKNKIITPKEIIENEKIVGKIKDIKSYISELERLVIQDNINSPVKIENKNLLRKRL